MAELRVAHTADLSVQDLQAVRALLVDAFDGHVTDEDYEHALGGVHALLWSGSTLIGHGSVVQRRLLHRGRALRTGYVEGVAVHADHRRRGHGGVLLAALERVTQRAYELGALSTSDAAVPFYTTRGWQLWTGSAWVIGPGGLARTPDDDGAIYVLPVSAELDLAGDLACDWRGGDVW